MLGIIMSAIVSLAVGLFTDSIPQVSAGVIKVAARRLKPWERDDYTSDWSANLAMMETHAERLMWASQCYWASLILAPPFYYYVALGLAKLSRKAMSLTAAALYKTKYGKEGEAYCRKARHPKHTKSKVREWKSLPLVLRLIWFLFNLSSRWAVRLECLRTPPTRSPTLIGLNTVSTSLSRAEHLFVYLALDCPPNWLALSDPP